MTLHLDTCKPFAVILCAATAMAATRCAADQETGPSLSQPRVNKEAEFAAPPLMLPAANQDDVTPTFAVEPPAESNATDEAPSASSAPASASSPDALEPVPSVGSGSPHRVHSPVEVEVIMPPVPVVTAPSQAVYEPIYKELPVTNHIMHIGARRFARCHRGMMHARLEVTNPAECDGCCYWVSAQVPSCCDGEPTRSGRLGVLGRGVVEYRWSCGWTVRVVFRTRGDVVVHYMAG